MVDQTNSRADLLNGDELHLMIFSRLEAMLDNPDKHAIYPTTEFMAGLKSDVVAYTESKVQEAYKKGYIEGGLARDSTNV